MPEKINAIQAQGQCAFQAEPQKKAVETASILPDR
jgi:hypothetical protein